MSIVSLKLGQGLLTLIDAVDEERVSKHAWTAQYWTNSNRYYVVARIKTGNRTKTQSLHRFVMRARRGQIVDHKNSCGLDNRKCNLRFVTHAQNMANHSGRHRRNTTGYCGVCKVGKNKFVAQCAGAYLGTFANGILAAYAYDAAARKRWGDAAYQNFPGGNAELGQRRMNRFELLRAWDEAASYQTSA
jgi:hypothetical protein